MQQTHYLATHDRGRAEQKYEELRRLGVAGLRIEDRDGTWNVYALTEDEDAH